MHYVIVDVETTGGSPKQSKITEIAMYKYDGEKIIDEYITLLNPEQKIPEFIVRLTGITDSMVDNAPKFYEAAKTILDFCDPDQVKVRQILEELEISMPQDGGDSDSDEDSDESDFSGEEDGKKKKGKGKKKK